jgi:phospholipid/cholesterol/gamma-HCH transport system ATP-binding protein
MPEFVVRFENVTVLYEDKPVLENISFGVGAGETRVILGSAGSGKTILLKTAAGLIRPDAGNVYVFDNNVARMREEDLFDIRSQIGVVFQEGALFDSLTIEENVAYPLLYQKARRRPDPASVSQRVREILTFVELEHTLEKYPSELSGGMRRRVGIARAVVTAPPLVLYDSPTAGLDPITANTIISLILKERDSRNTTAIMATHRFQDGHLMSGFRYNPSSGEVEKASTNGTGREGVKTKFLVLREGRLVFEGTERELWASTDPYVMKFSKR